MNYYVLHGWEGKEAYFKEGYFEENLFNGQFLADFFVVDGVGFFKFAKNELGCLAFGFYVTVFYIF